MEKNFLIHLSQYWFSVILTCSEKLEVGKKIRLYHAVV